MLVNVITYSAPPQSAEETLSLIPTEQFNEEALASQAAVSRFQCELNKRREFREEEEAEHRESERDRLDDVVRSKEDKLSELGPLLASILSSTVPVWDNLGVASHGQRERKCPWPGSSLPLYTYCTHSPRPAAKPATRRCWSW